MARPDKREPRSDLPALTPRAAARLVTAALERINEAVIITDGQLDLPGPHIVYVNPAFEEMTGYRASEVIGATPRILQGEATDRATLRRLKDDLRAGRLFSGEVVNYRKDGTPYDVSWSVTPIEDDEGVPTNYLAIQTDVTRQRERERRLAEDAEIARLVGAVGSIFTTQLRPERLVRSVLDGVLGLVQADATMLLYRTTNPSGDPVLRYAGRMKDGSRLALPEPPAADLLADEIAPPLPIFVPDTSDAAVPPLPEPFSAPGGLDVSALGVVPLRDRSDEPIAVLYVAGSSPESLDSRAQRIIVGIAAQAGIALESAQLYAREKRVASTFQRSLLPTSDVKIEGLEICTRYHPGAEGMQVGGDWFDVIARGGSKVGLAVGDVMGHGVQAAASMGQLRYAFRALLGAGRPPSEALAELNRIALEDEGIIATVCYAELDGATGELECWSAGHLPPLIAEAGGGNRYLEIQSAPLLGAVVDHHAPSVSDRVGEGDLLLLYTDGLIERRGESLDDGLRRLSEAMPIDPMTIDDLCDELYQVIAHQGDDSDDTAIVGVRRL